MKNSSNVEDRLAALDYIEDNLKWRVFSVGRGEEPRRDALVTAFREDWSPQVRARAAQVIAHSLYYTLRSHDREAVKTLQGAVFTEDSEEVRLAIIRTGLLESWHLTKIVDDMNENMEVREEAVTALVGQLYFNWKNIAEKALIRVATHPNSAIYPTRLKAAAVGSLLLATSVYSPHLENEGKEPRVYLIGNSEFDIARKARFILEWELGVIRGPSSSSRKKVPGELLEAAKTWMAQRGYRGNVGRLIAELAKLKI